MKPIKILFLTKFRKYLINRLDIDAHIPYNPINVDLFVKIAYSTFYQEKYSKMMGGIIIKYEIFQCENYQNLE